MKEENIIVFERHGADKDGDLYLVKKFTSPMAAFRHYIQNPAERVMAVIKDFEVKVK